MSIITTFMGLIGWDLPTDPYDHAQLAQNFVKLDAHDHTNTKGKQVPSAGILDLAITSAKIQSLAVNGSKLADNSVTSSKIVDGSIGSAELASESVTTAKIAPHSVGKDQLDLNIVPIGTVIQWYRPTGSVSLPTGWEICDGRAWSDISNSWGINSGAIPDLRNKFVLGASVSGTGSSASTPPDIGQPGGNHEQNLAHSHGVYDHSHSVPSHNHSIDSDGSHKHRWITETWDSNGSLIGTQLVDALQRGSAVPGAEGTRQCLYVGGLNRNQAHGEQVNAPMETVGPHSHGGLTGSSSVLSTAASGSSTADALGILDKRPSYVGLLMLMRVI